MMVSGSALAMMPVVVNVVRVLLVAMSMMGWIIMPMIVMSALVASMPGVGMEVGLSAGDVGGGNHSQCYIVT